MFFKSFYKDYISDLFCKVNSEDLQKLELALELLEKVSATEKKVILVGNGGSAAIANHITVDLINAAKINAVNFNNSSLITCFSNDFGYEMWVEKALSCYADAGDLAIMISSSGNSKNILNGVKKAKSMNLNVITLSGFSCDNPLRNMGDVNLWVDSNSYNIVEITHNIWLLAIVDFFIKRNRS